MSEDPFAKLEVQLKELDYPLLYPFKFICKSDNQIIAQLMALFGTDNKMDIKPSKKGNYSSLTVKETMLKAEDIISIYREAAKIKGVIIL